ncbi:hypothetical protein Leryth_007591 [Lithospermum erythrorhizon]|nr:hypothetical protein Leryth_007591 [Lithospermum erythrorhizon]
MLLFLLLSILAFLALHIFDVRPFGPISDLKVRPFGVRALTFEEADAQYLSFKGDSPVPFTCYDPEFQLVEGRNEYKLDLVQDCLYENHLGWAAGYGVPIYYSGKFYTCTRYQLPHKSVHQLDVVAQLRAVGDSDYVNLFFNRWTDVGLAAVFQWSSLRESQRKKLEERFRKGFPGNN